MSILGRGGLFQPPPIPNSQISGFFTSDEVFEFEIRYIAVEYYFKSVPSLSSAYFSALIHSMLHPVYQTTFLTFLFT